MEHKLLKEISEETGIQDLSTSDNIKLAKIALQMKVLEVLENSSQQKKVTSNVQKVTLQADFSGNKLSPEFNPLIEELGLLKKAGSNLQFKNIAKYLKVSSLFRNKSDEEIKNYFSQLRNELKEKFGILKRTASGQKYPYWPINFEAVEKIGANQNYHENLFDVEQIDLEHNISDPEPITF